MKLTLDNAIVNYEIKGNGLPVLIFNGFATDMSSMMKSMEPIFYKKNKFKRIYLDHPGVGETQVDDTVKSYKNVLDIIMKFIDKVVEEEKFVIVGSSFGGYIARYVLKEKFDKVEGLLLIYPLINPRMDENNVDTDIKEIIYYDKDVQKKIEKRIEDEIIGAMKKTDFTFLERLKNVEEGFNIKVDDLPKPFDKPALILTGKQDNQVGYKDAYNILSNYSRATFCVLDKAGHNLQIEQENLFNTLVNEWLVRVEEAL